MNRQLKKQLKTAFNGPEPSRKEAFLKQLTYPKATRLDFITTQMSYIRKRYWILSIALFGIVLGVCYKSEMPLTAVWTIASILPLLGLLSATELARSMSCNMTELEMSCKHHFAEIMLLRLMILGTTQIAVLMATLVVMGVQSVLGFWGMAFYLLTPFLLNTYVTLGLLNRIQSREVLPICAAVTGLISIVNATIMSQSSMIFSGIYQLIFGIAFVGLVGLIAYEMRKMIKEAEELKWNLLLTV